MQPGPSHSSCRAFSKHQASHRSLSVTVVLDTWEGPEKGQLLTAVTRRLVGSHCAPLCWLDLSLPHV